VPLVLTWLGSRPTTQFATARSLAALSFIAVLASGIAVRAMIFGLGTVVHILAG